ncbi:MAG: flagellar basal body-associated FliL family protein, partial [Campylobacterota bacterium]|nr:flagellar basal body-associated FliL family protein [Campylobacterota bacterium]
ILSLGYFTVNIDSVKNNKLMTKVTVEMQEDVIDMVMSNQAVIRDDVINSISNLESSDVNPTNISRYIKNSLNTRMQKDVVKGVYLEEFVIQ